MIQDPQRLSRLNALLDEGLDLDPVARAAWLEGLQGTDGDLAPRLRELLDRAGAESDAFMRHSAAELLPDAVLDPVDAQDLPGDRIGPYRLIEPLGSGGMSTVWRAERRDSSLVREVALKLPREGWGSGLARRMAQERNILASLEHPLIARLYDAGQTDDGRPWFAMELVDGVPIDEHCRRAALDLRARLTLYLQVLDAVACAHARLVVHRDLKPGNILVDTEGRVRLLDFGVAKLLDDGVQDAEQLLTRQHGRPITLPYASPEQLTHGPITVASDIYSLGVVLFELLTGKKPYPGDQHTRGQLESAILADERRLASRTVRERGLARALGGDIDAILTKALQVDPACRYSSVEAFAADLRRHIDGEPVLAQRASRTYLAGKFFRRHRWGLSATAAVALALVGGLAVALWQADAARTQAELAQLRQRQAEGVFRFVNGVLTNQVRADETITLRELLQRAEESMERTMGARPVERALATEALSQWHGSYGDIRQSIRLVTAAIALLPADGDPALLERLRCRLGMSLSLVGETQASQTAFDEALRAPSGDAPSRLVCELHRATVSRNLNRASEAMEWAQAARQTLARVPDALPAQRASVESELGYALVVAGKPSEAMPHFDAAVQWLESDPDVPPANVSFLFMNRAIALLAAGQPARAVSDLQRAVGFSRQRIPGGAVPAAILVNLGNALRGSGRLDDAERAFLEARERARSDSYPVMEAAGVMGIAVVKLDRADLVLAKPHLDEAEAMLSRMQLPAASPIHSNFRLLQAKWWFVSGQLARADEELAVHLSRLGDRAPASTSGVLVQRAEVARLRGDLKAAAAHLEAALTQARNAQGDFPTSASVALVLVNQAEIELLRGRVARAQELAAQALEHGLAAGGGHHVAVARARQLLSGRGDVPAATRP